jgi:hypothetical protein
MKLNRVWYVGIALVVVALIAVPLIWQLLMPYGGYGMMGRAYLFGMPMMTSFQQMMPLGMWFMWLIPLGVFILIGFAFGWAANQFTRKSS